MSAAELGEIVMVCVPMALAYFLGVYVGCKTTWQWIERQEKKRKD